MQQPDDRFLNSIIDEAVLPFRALAKSMVPKVGLPPLAKRNNLAQLEANIKAFISKRDWDLFCQWEMAATEWHTNVLSSALWHGFEWGIGNPQANKNVVELYAAEASNRIRYGHFPEMKAAHEDKMAQLQLGQVELVSIDAYVTALTVYHRELEAWGVRLGVAMGQAIQSVDQDGQFFIQ